MIFFSPFLCVRCPSVALKYHSTVRAGLGRSLSYGFWEPFHFALYMDEASTELTTCGCKLIPIDNRHERQVVFGRIPIPESTWVKEKSTQKRSSIGTCILPKFKRPNRNSWISIGFQLTMLNLCHQISFKLYLPLPLGKLYVHLSGNSI